MAPLDIRGRKSHAAATMQTAPASNRLSLPPHGNAGSPRKGGKRMAFLG
jgi:hypothetical protein